jgi:transposase
MLTVQEFRWLMEGLSIEQPKAIKKVKPGEIY